MNSVMFLSQVLSKTDHLMKSFFYNDNDKVRFYTGLHSFQVLMKAFHFIEPPVKRRSMHLNKFQEFIMVLMKLRLDVPHLGLAYRFDVSRPVVTIISLFCHNTFTGPSNTKKKKKKKKGNSKGTHYKVLGHKTTYSVNLQKTRHCIAKCGIPN